MGHSDRGAVRNAPRSPMESRSPDGGQPHHHAKIMTDSRQPTKLARTLRSEGRIIACPIRARCLGKLRGIKDFSGQMLANATRACPGQWPGDRASKRLPKLTVLASLPLQATDPMPLSAAVLTINT
jgi:hypothetical protein